MMRCTIPSSLLALFLAIGAFAASGARLVAQAPEAARPLPEVDPATRTGTLENGIRYCILRNAKPDNRVELRLVVRAGSLRETDSERGLAHLVEHMEFQGTGRFGPSEIVGFLESNGMRFGGDLNAQTSYTDTQYYLDLPASEASAIAKGLAVLEDWAHGPKVRPDLLENEKKVIKEEERLRRESAAGRGQAFAVESVLSGTPYAGREPIGDMGLVQGFTVADVERFASTWYRPEAMAVVIVGDIDATAMEETLLGAFREPFPAAPSSAPSFPPPLPPVARDATWFFSDPGLGTDLYSWWKVESPGLSSGEDMAKQSMLASVGLGSVQRRLDELARRPETPFARASVAASPGLGGTYVFSYSLLPRDGKAESAIEAYFAELKRAAAFGVTNTELELGRKRYLDGNEASLTQAGNIRNSTKSGELASWIVNGVALPFTRELYDYRKALGASLSRDEVNAYLARYILPKPAKLLVETMVRPIDRPPAEGRIAAIEAKALASKVAPPPERSVKVLVPSPPKKGSVASAKPVEGTPFTLWTLSNGLRVYVYRNSLTKNDFRLRAFAPGGLSTVPDSDYQNARFARAILGGNGAGGLDELELEDFLAGKKARVSFGFGDGEVSISGTSDPADPADMEKFFQLLYTELRGFRRDRDAERTALENIRQGLSADEQRPERRYRDEITKLLTNDAPRARPFTSDRTNELSPDRAAELAKRYFADALDFVLEGDFDEASLRSLVETYLASLPSDAGARPEAIRTPKDLGIRPTPGPATRVARASGDDRATVSIFVETPIAYDEGAARVAGVLQEALNIRMRELLRQEKGGTYSARAVAEIEPKPYPHAMVTISFTCSPENREALTKAALDELGAESSGSLSAASFAKALEIRKRSLETAEKTGSYWANALVGALSRGDDVAAIARRRELYAAITEEDVRALAAKIAKPDRALVAVQAPEAKSGSPTGSP